MAFYPLNNEYKTREINNRQPQGTPVGVSLAPGPNNNDGGSYQFTGQANSYIKFPNDGGLDVQRSITVLFWVNYKSRSSTPYQNLVSYINVKREKLGFGLSIYKKKLAGGMNDRAYEIESYWLATKTLEPDAWYFVGISYDDNTGIARLYADDIFVGQKNLTANGGVATDGNVLMGGFPNGYQNMQGRITNLRIFDVALTLTEINAVKVGMSDTYYLKDFLQNTKNCKI